MAPKPTKKKLTVKLEDLVFYFDGVERQRLDGAGWSRRSAEVLMLRDELLKMPAPAYEAVINTVKNVVLDKKPVGEDPSAVAKAKQKAAVKLFAAANGGNGPLGGPVEKV